MTGSTTAVARRAGINDANADTVHFDYACTRAQCPLSFPRCVDPSWGGSPEPRRAPSPGIRRFKNMEMADEGVGRGPGGPPHKLSDIAQECVRHDGFDRSGDPAFYPTLLPIAKERGTLSPSAER